MIQRLCCNQTTSPVPPRIRNMDVHPPHNALHQRQRSQETIASSMHKVPSSSLHHPLLLPHPLQLPQQPLLHPPSPRPLPLHPPHPHTTQDHQPHSLERMSPFSERDVRRNTHVFQELQVRAIAKTHRKVSISPPMLRRRTRLPRIIHLHLHQEPLLRVHQIRAEAFFPRAFRA